jgi:hypothetical protein
MMRVIVGRQATRFFWLVLLLGAVVCLTTSAEAQGAHFVMRAQLIWGTDGEKPQDAKMADTDPEFREKLAKIFRRKNYFVIEKQKIVLKPNGSNITSMSHNCVIEVKHLGETNFEVKLYGEGKLVQTIRQCMVKGKYLTLAGDVKKKEDETWIVALSLIEP